MEGRACRRIQKGRTSENGGRRTEKGGIRKQKRTKAKEKEICLRSAYQSLRPKRLWRLEKKAEICNYGVGQGMWEVVARLKTLCRVAGKNKYWAQGQTPSRVRRRAKRPTVSAHGKERPGVIYHSPTINPPGRNRLQQVYCLSLLIVSFFGEPRYTWRANREPTQGGRGGR